MTKFWLPSPCITTRPHLLLKPKRLDDWAWLCLPLVTSGQLQHQHTCSQTCLWVSSLFLTSDLPHASNRTFAVFYLAVINICGRNFSEYLLYAILGLQVLQWNTLFYCSSHPIFNAFFTVNVPSIDIALLGADWASGWSLTTWRVSFKSLWFNYFLPSGHEPSWSGLCHLDWNYKALSNILDLDDFHLSHFVCSCSRQHFPQDNRRNIWLCLHVFPRYVNTLTEKKDRCICWVTWIVEGRPTEKR